MASGDVLRPSWKTAGVVCASAGNHGQGVAFAAKLLGGPLILQEQNSIPGLANRMLARIAKHTGLTPEDL